MAIDDDFMRSAAISRMIAKENLEAFGNRSQFILVQLIARENDAGHFRTIVMSNLPEQAVIPAMKQLIGMDKLFKPTKMPDLN